MISLSSILVAALRPLSLYLLWLTTVYTTVDLPQYALDKLIGKLAERSEGRCNDRVHEAQAHHNVLQGGGATGAANGTSTECCTVLASSQAALDRVSEIVWDFPSSSNLSSAPYSDDTVLMHAVLDGVLHNIGSAKRLLASNAC